MVGETTADTTGVTGCVVARFPSGAMGQDLFLCCQELFNVPVILALGRQRLEEHELKDSLGYIARP